MSGIPQTEELLVDQRVIIALLWQLFQLVHTLGLGKWQKVFYFFEECNTLK